MKIALDVKNTKRALNPKNGDVILYDGKEWYNTTKEDLLQESREMLDKCKEELGKMRKEHNEFKREIASQLLEMNELIKQLYSK